MTTKGKFVESISVVDPDTKLDVQIEIYKLDGGGMIGVDSSFVELGEPIYSAFDNGVEVDIED